MNDGFTWWLIVLGIAIGVGLVWVFVVRLPRAESDVDAAELPAEAGWISRNIESYGGIAPQPLVEEVLELHRQYLVTGATPLPPTWTPASNGAEADAETTPTVRVVAPDPAPGPEWHEAPSAAHLPAQAVAPDTDSLGAAQTVAGASAEPEPAAIGRIEQASPEPFSEPDSGQATDSDQGSASLVD